MRKMILVTAKELNDVKDFYLKPDISTCLPDRKKVRKAGPTHILQKSLTKTYIQYNQEHRGVMGKSKFFSLRPKNLNFECEHYKNPVRIEEDGEHHENLVGIGKKTEVSPYLLLQQ